MARQRRHDQHLGLAGVGVLLEMQQIAEGQAQVDLLGHRDFAVADGHRVDPEGRAGVAELEARHHLHRGEHAALQIVPEPKSEHISQRHAPAGREANRGQHVVLELVGLVEHGAGLQTAGEVAKTLVQFLLRCERV